MAIVCKENGLLAAARIAAEEKALARGVAAFRLATGERVNLDGFTDRDESRIFREGVTLARQMRDEAAFNAAREALASGKGDDAALEAIEGAGVESPQRRGVILAAAKGGRPLRGFKRGPSKGLREASAMVRAAKPALAPVTGFTGIVKRKA